MRLPFTLTLLLLAPALGLAAAPVAMITDRTGEVRLGAETRPVALTREVEAGVPLMLPPGARVTLVVYGTGEELLLSGPGTFTLDAQGVPAGPAGGLRRHAGAALNLKGPLKPGGLAQASGVARATLALERADDALLGSLAAKGAAEADPTLAELTAQVPVSGVLPDTAPDPAPDLARGDGAPPTLRLETGRHLAGIRSLSLTRDGRWALTASEDKTARLWHLPEMDLIRTFRPEIEPGKVGMLYACALSPDGRWAAFGGWTKGGRHRHHRVILADTSSGRFTRILDSTGTVVNYLAFSPDGLRLAIHLGAGQGLRMVRVADGATVAADADYAQPTYRGAFDARGRYAASGDDGFLRLYDEQGVRVRKVRVETASPFGVAFSPDGQQLAVGYADSPRVEVRATRDLAVTSQPSPGRANLGVVAWSADGSALWAAGGEDFGPEGNAVRRWDLASGAVLDLPVAQATISELCPLPGGGMAFAAQDPDWGLLDAGGRLRCRSGAGLNYRTARAAFRVDASGTRFTLGAGRTFSLRDLAPAPGPWPQAPDGTAGPRIADWEDSRNPTVNGIPARLEPNEVCHALSLAPAGGAVLGTDWRLLAYDAQGTPGWTAVAPSPIWGLRHREDGKVVIALLADGTVRWFRTSDGRELLAFFQAEDRRWVAWTPTGYFAASPGGESLIGWQRNRPDQASDFFPVSHFRDWFYKPELLQPLLVTLDEASALALTATPHAFQVAAPAVAGLPPVAEITSPRPNASLQAGATRFQIAIRTFGAADAVKELHVFLDGGRVAARGAQPPEPPPSSAAEGGRIALYAVEVDLPARPARVAFQAELADGKRSELASLQVAPQGPPGEPPARRSPELHLLAVGVSTFADPRFNLEFSAKDARDVVDLFKAQEGRLFSRVEVTLLVDQQATEKAILEAMNRLKATATPATVTLCFFSSHGGTNPESTSYFLVPHDFGKSSGVDGKALRDRLEATQGKVLLLMDTCHSGNVMGAGKMRGLDEFVERTRFINEMLQVGPGMMILSSSSGAQVSLESSGWQNGAFTKAIREGLTGAADPEHTGAVTTRTLETYVRKRVEDMTLGRQTPVAARSEQAVPFPIAILK